MEGKYLGELVRLGRLLKIDDVIYRTDSEFGTFLLI